MIEKIRLVQNDSLPQIRLAVFDTESDSIAAMPAVTAVFLKFRQAGAPETVTSIEGAYFHSIGTCVFQFPQNVLSAAEGDYEGEVEFHFGSHIQTAYEVLKFHVRADF